MSLSLGGELGKGSIQQCLDKTLKDKKVKESLLSNQSLVKEIDYRGLLS